MESFFHFFVGSMIIFMCLSGVVPESIAVFLFGISILGVYEVIVDSSLFFGAMVCLTYVSALLILFLFFVALVPSYSGEFSGFSFFLISGVCLVFFFSLFSENNFLGFEGASSKFSFSVFFLSGGFCWYLLLFGLYLLLIVILVAKLVCRDEGALRVV